MPNPKENELIEKVIEFDQSIETNYRERETCAANGLRFCLFFMRSKPRQHSSPFCYITHQIKITLHCLSLSLSLISKSKTKSYLELYGDRLAWDFWMLLNSTVTGPFGIPEQQFSHFKHTYTYFYAFFHFYIFQKITKKKKKNLQIFHLKLLYQTPPTCFEIQKNFVLGLGSLLNYMGLCLFNWAIIIKILKLI